MKKARAGHSTGGSAYSNCTEGAPHHISIDKGKLKIKKMLKKCGKGENVGTTSRPLRGNARASGRKGRVLYKKQTIGRRLEEKKKKIVHR